jgi:hypothetical protein
LTVGCDVYANTNAIACKAGDAKVIASFPDVCLSPPSPPAGPVPVPYPNTSFDKDMQNGSKTVMIKGQEVMLKDQSFYKTAPLGDEAATNSFGGSVVTHVITGKTYFQAWSMDVQFEGQNVDRNLDLTGSNCASPPSDVSGNVSEVKKSEDEQPKCECCGGPVHSKAQREAKEAEKAGKDSPRAMTADEWHNPDYTDRGFPPNQEEKWAIENYTTLKTYLKEAGCDKLMHDDPNDPCAKHYLHLESNKELRAEHAASENPNNWEQVYDDYFVAKYGPTVAAQVVATAKKMRKAKAPKSQGGDGASGIAHRAPLAAGGCPVGEGNLEPVSADCKYYEDEMGSMQNTIKGYHIRAH